MQKISKYFSSSYLLVVLAVALLLLTARLGTEKLDLVAGYGTTIVSSQSDQSSNFLGFDCPGAVSCGGGG